jgi:hypothetical protein
MAGVLNVLLDLALFPAGGRIAELRVKKIVAGHCREAGVDLALLAATNSIHRSAHVVVNPAPWNAAKYPKRLIMSVEQHFMGLKKVSANKKGPAVRQLHVSDLQFDPLIANDRPILAPVELERFARLECQRHEDAAANSLLFSLSISFPVADKGGHAAIGAVETESHQIGMQLLDRAFLLARLARFRLQPSRQFVGQSIQLARSLGNFELRFDRARAQIFPDRVSRQACPSRNLSDRKLVPQRPAANNAQQRHVYHSVAPR